MKLSEHLDKGIWTIADKSLLLIYGFGVIVLVVNVLPREEWGAFYIFQSIFLIICVLSDSIFLQPMVKFGSEHEAEVGEVLAGSSRPQSKSRARCIRKAFIALCAPSDAGGSVHTSAQ